MLALSLGVSGAFAQKIKEADVPAAVKDGFKKSFPNAKANDWEKEDANFEVEFDHNKVETSALFDATGKLLETEVEIGASTLPGAIVEYCNKNMAGKKIKEASKITKADGTVMYEAEVEGADYLFDSNGKFVKKEVDAVKDEDDKKEKKK